MFKCNTKFENLEEIFVDLQDIMKNSLQGGVLDIKQLNKESDKYKKVITDFPDLKGADCVIYSKFMSKEFHESEKFVFIDKVGNTVCTLTGVDLDLYDMIKKCELLRESKEF